MGLTVDITGGEALVKQLALLSPARVNQAVRAATKRAATAANKEGSKLVRQVYTVKAKFVHSKTRIRTVDNGAIIEIRSAPEHIRAFKWAKRSFVFAQIKRGHGIRVPRSYVSPHQQTPMQRETSKRFPVRTLFGPSVTQMYQNAQVLPQVEKRGVEMLEKRISHEIDRLLGGTS